MTNPNQSNVVETIQTLVSKTNLAYNQAIMELTAHAGVTNPNINGALIEYLQANLSSTISNINGLLAQYSAAHFDGNVNSINDLTLV